MPAANALVLGADVSSEEDMNAAFAEIDKSFGKLDFTFAKPQPGPLRLRMQTRADASCALGDQKVRVFADNGFALHTASARIDLADGTAQGSETVRAQGPMGELNADSFRMERGGQRLFFKGNVRMTLQPGKAL